jgi:hypothetical protein
MAYKNKTICNPVTGQNITFLQTAQDTGGALLEMESVYNSTSKEPVPHYHPAQEEDFTVLEGSLSVKLNGQLRSYMPAIRCTFQKTKYMPCGIIQMVKQW